MSNQFQAVAVEFKDGRRLFGIWSPWSRHLAAPLFHELSDAESHLDCGIARLVDIESAEQSAEEVEVRQLGEDNAGSRLLTTQASWSEAHITGPCAA